MNWVYKYEHTAATHRETNSASHSNRICPRPPSVCSFPTQVHRERLYTLPKLKTASPPSLGTADYGPAAIQLLSSQHKEDLSCSGITVRSTTSTSARICSESSAYSNSLSPYNVRLIIITALHVF